MKAIGTGAPQVITLQLDDVELALYEDALNNWRLSLATRVTEAEEADREDWRNRELVACARLSQQLADADEGARLVGPTDLMLRLATDAAVESAHRLLGAIEDRRYDELPAAGAAAHACADTLAAVHHVDNHGLGQGDAVAV
jgi:hypothetical protein